MAWIKSSKTCVSVYGALDDMNQFAPPKTFDDAGPTTMQELQFFNHLAGDVAAAALAIATTLEDLLSSSYAGQYKPGFGANKAITSMAAILQTADKKVEQLSDTVDTIYNF